MDWIKCHYCKKKFPFGALTRDHVVPRAKGGRDIVENIVPSCGSCNVAKGDNMPDCGCEWCRHAVKMFLDGRAGVPVLRDWRFD